MPTKTIRRADTVSARPGASRKLLSRKSVSDMVARLAPGDPLEASFPPKRSNSPPQAEFAKACAPTVFQSVLAPAPADESTAAVPIDGLVSDAVPLPAPTWSANDETTFQAMVTRRKAAGFHRRGRDVSGQLIKIGEITPNAGTVMAEIVAVVAGRGAIERAALLDALAKVTFTHPQAKPSDRGWCQGYVAGALRDGFLALVTVNPVVTEEASQ